MGALGKVVSRTANAIGLRTQLSLGAGCAAFALLFVSFPVNSPSAQKRAQGSGAASAVSFGRDIRPILSDRCFVCHGPDPSTRKAKLQLDTFELATQERRGGAAIVPNRPQDSELIRRISSSDDDERMPPLDSHRKRLSPEEIALFERWIESGANYAEHWAFGPPVRPQVPTDAKHPVDAFIRAQLSLAGLAPSAPAAPELAIRRLFLDLTGLPATPAETDRFLFEAARGDADQVWLKWIRMLMEAEPYRTRYAERMTVPWLDQARYADTSGIHTDAGRQIWPWRDWVLHAYRSNLPFDQFLREQLAGDLIPAASRDSLIASGFNRNHITTDEGGALAEEYLVEYAADRAETTASVMLGLTVGCARCHDHKFDPIKQSDYYSLLAFFGSNDEPGLYSQASDPNRAFEPFIEVPSPEQLASRAELLQELEQSQAQLARQSPQDRAAMQAFFAALPEQLELDWAQLEVAAMHSLNGAKLELTEAGTILVSGANPSTDTHTIRLRTEARDLRLIQLDVLGHESFVGSAPGRASNGNAVLTGIRFEAISIRDNSQRQQLKLDWFWTDYAQDNEDWSLFRSFDPRADTGWAIGGHLDNNDRVALFLTESPFGYEGGTEVVVTLDYDYSYPSHAFGHVRLGLARLGLPGIARLPLAQGRWYHAGPFLPEPSVSPYASAFAPELQAELNFESQFDVEPGGNSRWTYQAGFKDEAINVLAEGVNVHYLAKEIFSANERSVEVSLGSDDGFEIFVNGESVAAREVPRGVAKDQDRATIPLRRGKNHFVLKIINTGGQSGFYFRALESAEILGGSLVAALAEKSAQKDRGAALAKSASHSWRLLGSAEYRAGLEQIAALEMRQDRLEASIPKTMVMRELEEPRPQFVLERGQYDKADESRPVTPDVPAFLGRLTPTDANGQARRATRLDLADWLTSPENPLVARVAVNRLWQMIFGYGLVSTSGDFGYQGAWPSHPELLDWLAVEFIESGWDVQALLTTLLSSQTYKQSSAVSAEALEVDPECALLAHYPRRRLDAERLRDQALYVAGLLQEEFGGPSVKPYHPPGLWTEVAMLESNTRLYERGQGTDLWRRSVYTYWKRACPPPTLMSFDAPTREACVVRRATTNTPLQALVLWNDEQYFEAARVLAQRTLLDESDEAGGIRIMFRRCTGREPSQREQELLSAALSDHRARFAADTEAADALVNVGEHMNSPALISSELAAWTMLASALLNLHATITQG